MAETNIANIVRNPLATRKGQAPINPKMEAAWLAALEKSGK